MWKKREDCLNLGNLQFLGLWKEDKKEVLEESKMTQGDGSENEAD